MLGYAFMGKAHSRALLALQHLAVPLRPELVSISGRNREALEGVREQWGWAEGVWRFDRAQAGTGALGDLGTHIVDIARYLVGEIVSVSGLVRTIVPCREVDDHFVAAVEFENGVAGTLEASRLARGRINSNTFEVNGSKGSLTFDVERLNELEAADTKSFRRVLVTALGHPFMRPWRPPGPNIGWGDTAPAQARDLP